MVGVVIAMEKEANILLDQMNIVSSLNISGKQVYRGMAFGKETVVIISGVGKVNAASATQLLISKFDVSKILNFGFAGGLNDSVKVLNVYAINKAVQYDFDLTQLNNTAIGTIDERDENFFSLPSLVDNYEFRALATGDRFNDSKEDYTLITDVLHTDIRDMEGAAIAQVGYFAQLPVYMFKVITDIANNTSTTEQFLDNCSKAAKVLAQELSQIFEQF